MMPEMSPVDVARRYLAALESRAPVESIAALLHPDAVIERLPNRLAPAGSLRRRDEALADVTRGRALLASERYEVTSALADGLRAVLEVSWSGVLDVSAGPLTAGQTLRARCSMHFELDAATGMLRHQRNYDCF